MSTLFLLPMSLIPQWFTNVGVMAAGGSIYTYIAGTTTQVTTYTDNTGTVANPNPMTLSSSGRPVSASGAPVAFWIPSGTLVKFVAFDAAGNQLDVLDNMGGIGDPAVATVNSGTFSMAVTGVQTAAAVNFRYVTSGSVNSGLVVLSWDDTGALISNSTAFGFTGFPYYLQGVTKIAQSPLLACEDNSTLGLGCTMTIPSSTGGTTVSLTPNNTAQAWTSSGTKRLFSGSFAYTLA